MARDVNSNLMQMHAQYIMLMLHVDDGIFALYIMCGYMAVLRIMDKMPADKMPPGHNATRHNATGTKCHRTKCH